MEDEEWRDRHWQQVSAGTYLAEGNYLYNHSDYRKALKKYNQAVELAPDDVSARLARSTCHLALGNSEQALEDAEVAMRKTQGPKVVNTKSNSPRKSSSPWRKKIELGHSTNWKTLYQKAEALFFKGEYEAALLMYHRGQHMRPNAAQFRIGIQRCEDVISKMCTYTPRRRDDDIFHLEEETQTSSTECSTDADHVLDLNHVTKLHDHSSYLHGLICDIDPSLAKGQDIHNLAKHTMRFCRKRSKFWRQRMPAIAAEESVYPIPADNGAPYHYALREMSKINEEMQDNRYEDCIDRAQRCIRTIRLYNEKDMENRDEVLGTLYSYMGVSYMELGNHKMALQSHDRDLKLAKKRHLYKAEARALENTARVHINMDNYEAAVRVWRERLSYHDTDQKRAWLYHELGYCQLALHRYEKATQCASKSYQFALKANDVEWQLNASTLIAQIEVLCGEYEEAGDTFRRAMDLAVLQDDIEAQNIIREALRGIDDAIVEKVKCRMDEYSIGSTPSQHSDVTQRSRDLEAKNEENDRGKETKEQ